MKSLKRLILAVVGFVPFIIISIIVEAIIEIVDLATTLSIIRKCSK